MERCPGLPRQQALHHDAGPRTREALARPLRQRGGTGVGPNQDGGSRAPDDLELGHRTQTWLAASDDPDATTSGGYWFHKHRKPPPSAALDPTFQDALLEELARLTDVRLR
jgi:hypothetical protein